MRLIIAALPLMLAGCLTDHCSGPPILLDGTPSQHMTLAGAQPGGYEVDVPASCTDGVTTIVVRAPGSRPLRGTDADAFFADLQADLTAGGIPAYSWTLGGRDCGATVVGGVAYTLQLIHWAQVDPALEKLGTALVAEDFGGAVSLEVGVTVACAM